MITPTTGDDVAPPVTKPFPDVATQLVASVDDHVARTVGVPAVE